MRLRLAIIAAAFAFYAVSTAAVFGQEGRMEKVITTDGREIVGTVTMRGSCLVVECPIKVVYLSPAIVKGRVPFVEDKELPVYRFHQELLTEKKKGKIALVPESVSWGRWGADGKIPITIADPKLGRVQFTGVISEISPFSYRVEGIEYEYRMNFPLGGMRDFLRGMVLNVIDAKDAAALVRGVEFFILAKDFATADGLIRRIEQAEPGHRQIPELREQRKKAFGRDQIEEVKRLAKTGEIRQAAEAAAALNLAEFDGETLEDATVLIKDLGGRVKSLREMDSLLAERKIEMPALTVEQGERMARIMKAARLRGDTVPDRHLPLLKNRWAEPLADFKFDEALLDTAAGLADEIAEFFMDEKCKNYQALGRKIANAKLPFELKLAIFKYATAYPEPPNGRGWHKVEFQTDGVARKLHYYIQIPSSYRPDTPCPALLALHGQHGDASGSNAIWGKETTRNGIILISPEYVYGRKDGYQYSHEEHRAVVGALEHAARVYNIDMNRVYLAGGSQGGHASWDIGGGQAGRFAGVIPVIGCSATYLAHDNYRDTAIYCVDGEDDGGAPVINRKSIDKLAHLGCDATYVEYKNRGHEGFYEEHPTIFEWIAAHVRPSVANELYIVAQQRSEVRRRWLGFRSFDIALPSRATNPPRLAQGKGSFENNQFNVITNNLKTVAVYLSPDQVDFNKPVSIMVNARGGRSFTPRIDWGLGLKDSYQRNDRLEVYLAQVLVNVP